MPQVSKVVRFYEPTQVDQSDQVVGIASGFWPTLLNKLAKQGHNKRIHSHNGGNYYGETKRGRRPAVRYLYVGRLRDRDDWPDTFAPQSGVVADLNVPGLLVEPTYVVPFGANNFCAVMTPRAGGISGSALDSWFTAACGLTTTADRIEMRPIIDKAVLTKLNQRAVGATKLSVRVAPGTVISDQLGGGEVGNAIRAATSDTTAELYAELTWSFGHSRGSENWRDKLLTGAQWIARQDWVEKANVSMLIPETDGDVETIRSENHDLFRDRIAYTSKFEVAEGQKPSELSVLTAIQESIDRFNRER